MGLTSAEGDGGNGVTTLRCVQDSCGVQVEAAGAAPVDGFGSIHRTLCLILWQS